LGVLTVHFDKPHTPSERELRWSDLFAQMAANLVERAGAETALRESEERYQALFAASPAPTLIVKPDAPRFTIADVNDAYLRATI
jgi:PAS domain-containing protein